LYGIGGILAAHRGLIAALGIGISLGMARIIAKTHRASQRIARRRRSSASARNIAVVKRNVGGGVAYDGARRGARRHVRS